jgi:hypothetical protein
MNPRSAALAQNPICHTRARATHSENALTSSYPSQAKSQQDVCSVITVQVVLVFVFVFVSFQNMGLDRMEMQGHRQCRDCYDGRASGS